MTHENTLRRCVTALGRNYIAEARRLEEHNTWRHCFTLSASDGEDVSPRVLQEMRSLMIERGAHVTTNLTMVSSVEGRVDVSFAVIGDKASVK